MSSSRAKGLILVTVPEKTSAYKSTYSEKRFRRFLLNGRHLPGYMTTHHGYFLKFKPDNTDGAGVKLCKEKVIFFAAAQTSAKHGRDLRPLIGCMFHNQLP